MPPIFPDHSKESGLSYALTDDGLELPVIDVTQPAFKIPLDQAGLEALLQQFLRDVKGPQRTPAFLRTLLFSFMRRRSIIMRGLMGASGTFMSGMNTYLIKLGPDNLPAPFFSSIDRRIAASPAGTFMRLRLQDVAHLLAEALIPVLAAKRGTTLHLLNIGGGSAMDSLNALLVIRKKQPGLLAGRQIHVYSLDRDKAGPNFGAHALAALMSPGAPLHGLLADFRHVLYDWSNPDGLHALAQPFQNETAIIAASSEGALFEYGSDQDIAGNLKTLSDITPADSVVAGSVTRADELGRILNGSNLGSRAAIQFHGLEAFAALALGSGWKLARVIDRPLSHDVLLEKAWTG